MARCGVVVVAAALVVLLACYHVGPSMTVHLSALGETLAVTASPRVGQVLYAGQDTITVTWSLNATAPAGTDAVYKAIKASLCYAPASQQDRGWRKDKACQFKIAHQPYAGAGGATFEYRVAHDVPTAYYYVLAYALDASGAQVAYGQSAPMYLGVTGVHPSIDVAAGVLSAFSVAALVFHRREP